MDADVTITLCLLYSDPQILLIATFYQHPSIGNALSHSCIKIRLPSLVQVPTNDEQHGNGIGIAADALLGQTKTKLKMWRLRLSECFWESKVEYDHVIDRVFL